MSKNENQNKEQKKSENNVSNIFSSQSIKSALAPIAFVMSVTYLGFAAYAGSEVHDANEKIDYYTQNKEELVDGIRKDFKAACVEDQARGIIIRQLQQGPNINIEFNSNTQRTEDCMTNKAVQRVESATNMWKEAKTNNVQDVMFLLLTAGVMAGLGGAVARKTKLKQDQSPGNKPPKQDL